MHVSHLFTDVLTEALPEARGDVNGGVTRWLSGARDHRAGSEPARKKSRAEPPAPQAEMPLRTVEEPPNTAE